MWRISAWAFELDEWLKQHVGRPYTIVLGISLGFGIVATAGNLGHMAQTPVRPSPGSLASLLAAGVVQVGLLINQLAQLHEYRQGARQRRAARRERKAARERAEDPSSRAPD